MADYADPDYYEADYDEEGVDFVDEGPASMTLNQMFSDCLEPTFTEAATQISWLLCSCLVLRLLKHQLNVSQRIQHGISFLLGLVALFSVVGDAAVFTVGLACLGYFLVKDDSGLPFAYFATFTLGGYLVFREYVGIFPESWEQVRGIQMIMVMKVLSICFDKRIGEKKIATPKIEEYLGYMFSPATVIFGPWLPFRVYCDMFQTETKTAKWLVPAFTAAICAFASLGISSCLLYWIFSATQSKWILAMQDAMSVRFSHYFISFLSEFTCLLCGYVNESDFTVTEPLKIEFPRSLVDVVVYWNKPMHRWLRGYIFRPIRQFGTFKAVLLTFVVSSMLHGFNFGLTSVLLSLGFYTYVEHSLREKLSSIFNACIRSRTCKNCEHDFKSSHPMVVLVNFGFCLLALFNLAYLGIMISKNHAESGVSQQSPWESIYKDISKWKDLHFLSHWVMISVCLANSLI